MKKRTLYFSNFIIFFSFFFQTTTALGQNQLHCDSYQVGDLNLDNDVNVIDIQILVTHILYPQSQVTCQENLDFDGDNKKSIFDILILVNLILKQEPQEFVSANLASNLMTYNKTMTEVQVMEDATSTDEQGTDTTLIEEGDIYRIIRPGLIANLNSWRGLQLIDLKNLDNIRVSGEYPVVGSPLELYSLESEQNERDFVLVLINHWKNFYLDKRSKLHNQEGALVLLIDISDIEKPVEVDRVFFPGTIRKSRLAKNDQQSRLYLISSEWKQTKNEEGLGFPWQNQTFARSFLIKPQKNKIEQVQSIELDNNISEIQGTPTAIILARNEYDWQNGHKSYVSLLNIEDKNATISLSKEVAVKGRVENQFNLDLYNGVLRVVSEGGSWNERINHIETFNANDLSGIDQATFGANESLFATIFLGNKAFFVTYFLQDPFHAFSIDEKGNVEEKSEFIVSGWNDFFKPVFSQKRLIGTGIDDASGSRKMALSLYDITDLENPNPLITRESIDLSSSWSQAQFDHKAFTVLEEVVNIESLVTEDTKNEVMTETGLVLLPFSGWSEVDNKYINAVQLFTFSNQSLSKRGILKHKSSVQRSILAKENIAANLSRDSLTVYDISQPDDPDKQGEVELAPNYSDLFYFKNENTSYFLRVKNEKDSFLPWWDSDSSMNHFATIDVFKSKDDLLSERNPFKSFQVPAYASLYQSGNYLVSVLNEQENSLLNIWDFNQTLQDDIIKPIAILETNLLINNNSHPLPYFSVTDECFDCRRVWPENNLDENVKSFIGGLAFINKEFSYTKADDCLRNNDPVLEKSDFMIEPSLEEPYFCSPHNTYQENIKLHILDLNDPYNPIIYYEIDLPPDMNQKSEELISTFVNKDSLWLNTKEPLEQEKREDQPTAKHYSYKLPLDNLEKMTFEKRINLPGVIFSTFKNKDTNFILTRDQQWDKKNNLKTSLVSLEHKKDKVVKLDSYDFHGEAIQKIITKNDFDIFIQTQTYSEVVTDDLIVVTKNPYGLEEKSRTRLSQGLSLKDVVDNKLFFSVAGGIISYELNENPRPQAFLPANGWPRQLIFEGKDVFFAAGRYGIYGFQIDIENIFKKDNLED